MQEWRQYRAIEKGEFFVVFSDTSAGMGDNCATQFLSVDRRDIPLVYHSPSIATTMTNVLHPVLEKIHDITGINPIIAYERQNGGAFEMDRLSSMNRLNKYTIFKMPSIGREDAPESMRLGWDTTSATRPKMLQDLKDSIEHKVYAIYDMPTIRELFSLVLVQTTSTWKAQAERGSHDDLVMSLAGVIQLAQMCPKPQTQESLVSSYDEIPDYTPIW